MNKASKKQRETDLRPDEVSLRYFNKELWNE